MTINTPITAGKSLLGAAFAGLSLLPVDADAGVTFIYDSTTDFSNNYNLPTDLTGQYTNYTNSTRIEGSISSGDYSDNFKVAMTPFAQVSIDMKATFAASGEYFWMTVSNADSPFTQLATTSDLVSTSANQQISRTLTFTVPQSGRVTFSTGYEGGSPVNYAIGSVPEPTTGLLGLAGLAAAALHRRRRND